MAKPLPPRYSKTWHDEASFTTQVFNQKACPMLANEEASVVAVIGNRSSSIGALAAALAKAQGEMGAATKDAVNPFFKSKYADLASVWEACRGPLSKYELCVLQPIKGQGASVTVTTILAHSSGEWISEDLTLTAKDDSPQSIGSACTYGRRYGLSSMVGIAPDDDDDGNAAQPEASAAAQQARQVPRRAQEPLQPGALRVTIAKVAKTGENAKGPWTLYAVKFSDGREATTFSKSVFQAAESFAHDGREVEAVIEGKNLTELRPVFQQREQLAEEGERVPF